MTESPPEVEFHARGAIARLFQTRAPEVLVEGPAGTGKTMGLVTYADWLAWQHPGCRILFVRATRTSLTQSVLVTYESKVLMQAEIASGARRDNRSSYVYPNHSEIVCGGMDHPDRLMSTEYDFIFVFEATEVSEDAWEKLASRLRNNVAPYQQIVADCNPGAPSHWLNRRAANGKMERLLSRHPDNPAMWDGANWTEYGRQYLARLDRMSGVRRRRLLDGVWAQAEGVVYPDFDPATHVISAMPEGWEAWPKYRAIDFGYTNPFVVQWWAVDPDGRLYLYRECYRSRRLVSDWAKIINAFGGAFVATVADHDAEDRATLDAGGIPTIAANKGVEVGIQAVQARLTPAGDGRPRLFVLRTSLVERDPERDDRGQPCGVLEEFETYAWQPDKDGRAAKEEPVKEHDHSMDTLRYMVMHFDWAGERAGVMMAGPASAPAERGSFAALARAWGR